jgi:hypothetical protein
MELNEPPDGNIAKPAQDDDTKTRKENGIIEIDVDYSPVDSRYQR